MKRILAVMVAAAAIALVAVPAGTAAPAARKPSIVQIAASSPQFSTLVKLIKSAGLTRALSGKRALTVFAPTDAAFRQVPSKTLNKLARDKKLLRAVLLYHVARGKLLAAQVVKRHTIKTLNGARVNIHVRKGSVYVNQARVIKADVVASNGVIHVINRVLIPPS